MCVMAAINLTEIEVKMVSIDDYQEWKSFDVIIEAEIEVLRAIIIMMIMIYVINGFYLVVLGI